MSGDSVRVAQPLFPVEGQGSIPMSPLQFEIEPMSRKTFLSFNRKFHSRLPICGNCWDGVCYQAVYKNIIFAVAWWSKPIAQNRLKNGRYIYELRRMAITDDAPKNTASRFLSVMCKILKKKYQHIFKFISYQDTNVHAGTIYKASNWKAVETQNSFQSWKNRPNRIDQSASIKIRWEKQIRPEPEAIIKPPKKSSQKGLFD